MTSSLSRLQYDRRNFRMGELPDGIAIEVTITDDAAQVAILGTRSMKVMN